MRNNDLHFLHWNLIENIFKFFYVFPFIALTFSTTFLIYASLKHNSFPNIFILNNTHLSYKYWLHRKIPAWTATTISLIKRIEYYNTLGRLCNRKRSNYMTVTDTSLSSDERSPALFKRIGSSTCQSFNKSYSSEQQIRL